MDTSRPLDPVSAADQIVALHATVARAPYLSLYARLASFGAADLDRALYEERSLVRVRCMRGTLFLVSRAVLPVVYGATKRLCLDLVERYVASMGVSHSDYERLRDRILDVVEGGALTAAEIQREAGVGRALSPVLYLMCDEGLLARDRPAGAGRGNVWRYGRFDRLLPGVRLDGLTQDEATAALVERYVRSYGPVALADAAWWSGLPLRQVRAAVAELGDVLVPCALEGSSEAHLVHADDLGWLESERAVRDEAPEMRLLPPLDPYVMGYADRSRLLDPAHRAFAVDRAGNVTSTIVERGRVVGVWDLDDSEAAVLCLAFEPLSAPSREALELEAAAVGRFAFGNEAVVRHVATMPPLAQQSSGGFLAPLSGRLPAGR